MNLRELIDRGANKAGTLTALGKILDVSQPNMSHARAMRKPLTMRHVVALADYIGEDLRLVIAANELVTETNNEKRQYWLNTLAGAATKAACITLLVTGTGTDALADQTLTASADRANLYYVKSGMQIGLRNRNKRGNDRTGHRHRRTQIDRRRCTPARRLKRTRSSAFFLRLRSGTMAGTNNRFWQR